MTSKRSTKEPEKRTEKPEPDPKEEQAAPPAPSSGRTFETDREGVHSATEGGIPDPSVQPGGGTVTDPIPGAAQK